MIEKKYVESMRGKTYYWMSRNHSKNGHNLVFLHGMTADHTLFKEQMEYFKNKYTVILLDLPLHGASRPYNNFTYKNVCLDLKDILDVENIKSAVFIGQSMGGFILQEFMNEFPQYTEGFIAVDSAPLGRKHYSKTERLLLKESSSFVLLYPYKFLIKWMARNAVETKRAYDNYHNMLKKLSKKEISNIVRLCFKEFFKFEDAALYNENVLLIAGEHDISGSIKKYSEKWHKEKGYPLKIIHHAAHNSNDDNPKEFNYVVNEFIQSIQ